jgi:hypothetical protein
MWFFNASARSKPATPPPEMMPLRSWTGTVGVGAEEEEDEDDMND